jgi:hypothetical protein
MIINDLVKTVRGDLNLLQRTLVCNLLITNVNFKDIS